MGLALLVGIALFVNTHTAPITCNVGSYIVGQPSSITCNFRKNISASQRSFSMARYPSNAKQFGTGTDVLLCHWSDENQEHECVVAYGYTFDNVITDQVTVKIPDTDQEFEGLYRCFFVPPQETESHACDFKITLESMVALNNQTAPPPNEDETSHPMWTAGIGVAVGVAALVAILVCAHKQCKKKKHGKVVTFSAAPLIAPKNKQMHKLLRGFELPKNNLEPSPKTIRKLTQRSKKHSEDLMDILDRELKQGLDNITRSDDGSITRSDENNITRSNADDVTPSKAALQMSLTCCPLLNPSSNAECLVVDWGCTCLTISLVQKRSNVALTTSERYTMQPEMKTGTGNQISNFIAESINTFVCDQKLARKTHNAVLILPFPCHKTSPEKERLAKGTSEFRCEDVNKDLHDLLKKSLQSKQTPCKIVAIVNDAVSTLVSVAYKHPGCKIALTEGSRLNSCHVETWTCEGTNIPKEALQEEVIYNTELGALGDNGCLKEFRTDFDRELDDSSSIPGSQIFEKMVSWTYIGEIVRLALKRLKTDDLILPSEKLGCKLLQQGYITSDLVATIRSDTESPYKKTEDILTELEVRQCTEEDLTTIRYVCGLVCDRAAYLTSAALATLINHLNKLDGVVIVVDGELNKKLPSFGELLHSTTSKLVKPELKDQFFLVSSNGRRNFGAALIAEATVRQAQVAASSYSSQ